MRRTYMIVGGVIVLAAVGLIIFVLVNRGSSTPSTGPGATGTLPGVATGNGGNGNAGSATGGTGAASTPVALPPLGATSGGSTSGAVTPHMGILSNELVLEYFVSPTNVVTTVHPDGKIESITNGQSTYLSSSEIHNVVSASFSNDGKKILIGFGSATSPQWSVFDVASKAWSVLPVSPMAAVWAPSGYTIAYFAPASGGTALSTLDLSSSKSKPRALVTFPSEDFVLSWHSPDEIILADRPSAVFSGSIFALNVKTGVLRNIVLNRVGLEAQWNQSATMAVILAGTSLARGGELGIIDANGTLLHAMNFLTLPSKCAFTPPAPPTPPVVKTTTKASTSTPSSTPTSASSSATSTTPVLPGLICAIPQDTNALQRVGLPDTYEQKMLYTADTFYGITLNTGSLIPLFRDDSQSFDATDVKIVNGSIFFVNRYNEKLYGLILK